MQEPEKTPRLSDGGPGPRLLGTYIVSDPRICHGKLTFRGTRILVKDVLDQVASGKDWDEIIGDWRGDISKEAIAEAVRLAGAALFTQQDKSVAG